MVALVGEEQSFKVYPVENSEKTAKQVIDVMKL